MNDDVSSRIAALTPMQRALLSLKEMQAKLDKLERARNEPIAVVGIGCRLPGGSDSPDAFWKLLHNGLDAIVEVPPDRYPVDDFFEPDLSSTKSMNTRWGGFVKDIADFDAGFFGISTREASSIDPQQRLLLESSWMALEDAGLAANRLAGSATGVYMGMSTWDYSSLQLEAPSRGATGLAFSIAANRLSYFFDFQGPSLVLDSACSSSVVAVDLACQSLRSGDIDIGLAGGVNALLCPYTTVSLSQAGFLSQDGRCKTFDETANGYVRGEGCGVVVLKRLSDAIAQNHHIYGIIRGAAVNQDGKSNGLTAPNGLAQQRAVRKALGKAGVRPDEVSYVEAHGTGTALGDVVELESIWAVLSENRAQDNICRVGSVKTNIGHIEPASGIAGLIKVMLSFENEEIAPHLNLKKINPALTMDSRMQIPLTSYPWPRTETPRYAGLSAFGFGGTNSHLILAEPPVPAPVPAGIERPVQMLTLSGRTGSALTQLAKRYLSYLDGQPSASLADVSHTANTGRVPFEHRLTARVASWDDLRKCLNGFISGAEAPGLAQGIVKGQARLRIAFSFAPETAHYPGMGSRLYETQPAFRKVIDDCDELLRAEFQRGLLPLGQCSWARPALFAIEYGLAQLWRSWGIEPAINSGEGVGEYAAACAAGTMEWKSALRALVQPGGASPAPAGAAQASVDFTIGIGSGGSSQSTNGAGRRVPSIEQGRDEWETLLSSLSVLYLSGAPVDWKGFDRDYPRRLVRLPTYPFERKRCYMDASELRPCPGPFQKVEA